MAQLRGKVVILDFWTYGCINCMHVLRDLKTLEQRFPEELVVIGVHSPKFTNEKSTANTEADSRALRDRAPRWRTTPTSKSGGATARRTWPTRVIIDPAGNLVGTAMGEGNLEGFLNATPNRGPCLQRAR
jgi:thiol-disulfide isomerase/thioredoxin